MLDMLLSLSVVSLLLILIYIVTQCLINRVVWLHYALLRRKCPRCGSRQFLKMRDESGIMTAICFQCHQGFYIDDEWMHIQRIPCGRRDLLIGHYTNWDVNMSFFDNVPWALRVYLRNQDDPFWKEIK